MNTKPTYQATNPNAPIVVLFGGSPIRRDEVVSLILKVGEATIYGALSEEEGNEIIDQLQYIDLILIGGRYSENQRIIIRNFAKQKFTDIKFTEPGWDYDYQNEKIKEDIKSKLNF